MTYLIAARQIEDAIDAAGLRYVQQRNPDICVQLSVWLSELLTAPRNLTAIRDPEQAIARHVIEPLRGRDRLIGSDLAVPHGRLIDIGSGGGAPGLPFALCEPGRAATLLDSRAGAGEFLDGVVRRINAPWIEVLRTRAEAAARSPLRETCALALSRAAAPPTIALELMIPFLQTGGISVAWTGELSEVDHARAATTAAALGAELTPIDGQQDLLVATKARATESTYPRSWQRIRRRPLGADPWTSRPADTSASD